VLGVVTVVAGLSTGNKIGLAVVGGAFIVFALLSSFVLPKRYPNFPGRHVGWFVVAGVCFLLAMLTAVLVFGVEEPPASESAGTTAAQTTTAETTTAQTTTSQTTTAETTTATSTEDNGGGGGGGAGQGDAAAGKAVFASAGCGGCHTLKAAKASGNVGPNLDQLKPSFDQVEHQVETGGGAMPSFKGALSDKQIADVSAFVSSSASG
jgi:mono/diheme cytochrome c family protein